MKKMKGLISMFFIALASVVSAQSTDTIVSGAKFTPEKYKHKIGMAAGFLTGVGFSYQFKPNRLGVIVTGIPYVDEDSKFVSAGITFRYDVAQMENGRVFIYQGNHYIYREYTHDYYYNDYDYYNDYYNDNYEPRIDGQSSFSTGVGLGGELFLGKRFTSNLMLGYGAHNNFKVLNASIEGGVYFKF